MFAGMKPSLHAQRAIEAFEEENVRKAAAARVTLAFMLLACLLAAILSCGCCVSKTEFGSFTSATRRYFDASVAPLRSSIEAADLDPQSKKNRLGFVDDYEAVLKSAEERRDGAKKE